MDVSRALRQNHPLRVSIAEDEGILRSKRVSGASHIKRDVIKVLPELTLVKCGKGDFLKGTKRMCNWSNIKNYFFMLIKKIYINRSSCYEGNLRVQKLNFFSANSSAGKQIEKFLCSWYNYITLSVSRI